MISLSRLNAAPDSDFLAVLGGVYEHSDWVARRVMKLRPFPGRETLRSAMRRAVDIATDAEKLALIQSHPDLAGKLARAGELTEASMNEQASLGLDRLGEHEYQQFRLCNERYREKFKFPFIICARLTTKQGVLDAFENRLENSRDDEIREALRQIHGIARLRLEDILQ